MSLQINLLFAINLIIEKKKIKKIFIKSWKKYMYLRLL